MYKMYGGLPIVAIILTTFLMVMYIAQVVVTAAPTVNLPRQQSGGNPFKRLSLFRNIFSSSNNNVNGDSSPNSNNNGIASKTSKYNFKIYVYDLPLWANSLIHKRNPWCSNGVFSSEIYIHKQLLDNVHGVRTFDPEEADFFFIPVYATCLVYRSFSQFPKYRFLVEEVLKYIINEFPYWKRKYIIIY